jgi:hypothetical protein
VVDKTKPIASPALAIRPFLNSLLAGFDQRRNAGGIDC